MDTTGDPGNSPPFATQVRPRDAVDRDRKVPGLTLRHRATRSSWHLYYRSKDGRERRPKIGDARSLSRAQARDIARQWLAVVATGGDPSPDRDRRTVADLERRFLEVHAPKRKAKTGEMYRIAWGHIRPRLGSLPVASVTRKDVADLHHALRETPSQANRTVAVLRKALNLAEVWGWRPPRTNPVYGIEFNRERKRRRYPSVAESAALARALDSCGDIYFVGLVWLIALTGCRPSEIRTARRSWIEGGVLALPDSKTGEKEVVLPEPAQEIIAGLPVIEGNPYLIPGQRRGRPLIGVGKKWRRLCAAADIKGLQLRDLRRYFASVGLSKAGLTLEAVGQLLGHTQFQTTKVYAYLMRDAQRAGVEAVAAEIAKSLRANPRADSWTGPPTRGLAGCGT